MRVVETETIHEVIARTGGYPVICSHRGGGFKFAPENTMYAFKKSVHYGVRLLELDITHTKDLQLVIIHWPFVDVTTDGHGWVANYTLEELRQLDAARHYPRLRGTGITIPTLREFLDHFAPMKDLLFMFDFKDYVTLSLTRAFIAEHYSYIEGRYILGSVLATPNELLRVYYDSHEVPICTDISETFKITILYLLGLLDHYEFKHTLYGFILLPLTRVFFTRGLVDELHRRGLLVLVCGSELNDALVIEQCVAYGVDFVMLDRPDVYFRHNRTATRRKYGLEDT